MKSISFITIICVGYIICFFVFDLPIENENKTTEIKFEYGCNANQFFVDTISTKDFENIETLHNKKI